MFPAWKLPCTETAALSLWDQAWVRVSLRVFLSLHAYLYAGLSSDSASTMRKVLDAWCGICSTCYVLRGFFFPQFVHFTKNKIIPFVLEQHSFLVIELVCTSNKARLNPSFKDHSETEFQALNLLLREWKKNQKFCWSQLVVVRTKIISCK